MGHFIYRKGSGLYDIDAKLKTDKDRWRCRESVSDGGRLVTMHQCEKAANVEETIDGKKYWFCSIHSQYAQDRRSEKGRLAYEKKVAFDRRLGLSPVLKDLIEMRRLWDEEDVPIGKRHPIAVKIKALLASLDV